MSLGIGRGDTLMRFHDYIYYTYTIAMEVKLGTGLDGVRRCWTGLDMVGQGWTGLDRVGRGWTASNGVRRGWTGLDGVGWGGKGW